nr:MAG TPA: zinc binding domain protein [Caudoviricetes sp.]DAV74852.1 MAG TPA: zinc binding domain protein [Caudoviricetes sp.]
MKLIISKILLFNLYSLLVVTPYPLSSCPRCSENIYCRIFQKTVTRITLRSLAFNLIK